MSICVECGEFERFYVPACGDPAVGESNVLLYAGYARLRAVLDGGSARKFETLVRAINSLPANTMLAGEPVHVRNVV